MPGGVNPVVDGAVYSTLITKNCADKQWTAVPVSVGVEHTLAFELGTSFLRKDNTVKDSIGPLAEGGEKYISFVLTAAPGPNTGTLHLVARDAETGTYLGARPDIDGVGGEDSGSSEKDSTPKDKGGGLNE